MLENELPQILGEQFISLIPIVGISFLIISGAISFTTRNPYIFGVSLIFNVILALNITLYETSQPFSDVIKEGNVVKVEKEILENFNFSSGNIILNPKEVNVENNDNLEMRIINGPLIISKNGEKWNCVQKENNWACETKK